MIWLRTVASRLSHPAALWQLFVWTVGIRAGAKRRGGRGSVLVDGVEVARGVARWGRR